jgi:hypothetical protein
VLHDDPQVLVPGEGAEVADDVLVRALLEDGDLATDVLDALLVLPGEGDDLDGDDASAGAVTRLWRRTMRAGVGVGRVGAP